MNGVEAHGSEFIERMLKRFKRVTESSGIQSELKQRQSYEKPCDKRRRERKAAVRKANYVPSVKSRRRKDQEEGKDNRDRRA